MSGSQGRPWWWRLGYGLLLLLVFAGCLYVAALTQIHAIVREHGGVLAHSEIAGCP